MTAKELADPKTPLCCVILDGGMQCQQKARFWVGANHLDDYTHVCGDHLGEVKRDGDVVMTMQEAYQGGSL